MFYPIIDFQRNDINAFIKQWSSFYNYSKMNLYDDNIGEFFFEKRNLEKLYEWKNGTSLSEKKTKSLESNILSKLVKINEFKANFDEKTCLDEFEKVSFVWKIFLLHIISPNSYPIYDQHVHRTYLFLNHNKSFEEIDNTISEKEKSEFYFKTYLPFIRSTIEENSEFKIQDIDKAFFSFGQFLKKYKVELEK